MDSIRIDFNQIARDNKSAGMRVLGKADWCDEM